MVMDVPETVEREQHGFQYLDALLLFEQEALEPELDELVSDNNSSLTGFPVHDYESKSSRHHFCPTLIESGQVDRLIERDSFSLTTWKVL